MFATIIKELHVERKQTDGARARVSYVYVVVSFGAEGKRPSTTL